MAEWDYSLEEGFSEAFGEVFSAPAQRTTTPVETSVGHLIHARLAPQVPSGYATWGPYTLECARSPRAARIAHTVAVWPEAVVHVDIATDGVARGQHLDVRAMVGKRPVDVRWGTGSMAGRLLGIPWVPGATLLVLLRPAGESEPCCMVWEGAMGARPQDPVRCAFSWEQRLPWTDAMAFAWSDAGRLGSLLDLRGFPRWSCEPASGGGEGAKLRASVTRSDGVPVADALVVATRGDVKVAARTDVAGRASFSTLTPGPWRVQALHLGLLHVAEQVEVHPLTAVSIDLREPEGGTVHLHVVDATAAPVPCAEAVLYPYEYCDVASDGTQRTGLHVDALGRRTFERVPPGALRLLVLHGIREGWAEIDVMDGGTHHLRVTLPELVKDPAK